MSGYEMIKSTCEKMKISKIYSLKGLCFEIYSDSQLLFDKVDEFIYPHLYEQKDNCGEEWDKWNIYYIKGKVDLSEKREEKIVDFYGSNSLVKAEYYEQDGVHFYYNEESNSETMIEPAHNRVYIIYDNDAYDLNLLEDCYSIIRSIIYNKLVEEGCLLIHGCTFRFNGKTILLVGEKGVGKTTIEHYCLQEGQANFISADRTILWIQNNEVFCSGWISTYRTKMDIFNLMPERESTRRFIEYYESKKEDDLYYDMGKIRISPGFLLQIMNIESKAISQLDYIIVLDNSNQKSEYELELVKECERKNILDKYTIKYEEFGVENLAFGKEKSIIATDLVEEQVLNKIKILKLTGRGELKTVKNLFEKLC